MKTLPDPARSNSRGEQIGTALATDAGLDVGTLAELDDATLAAMARDELARVIIASGHPWRDDGLEARLPYADRPTLLRMAFLARVCSRHRLDIGGRQLPAG